MIKSIGGASRRWIIRAVEDSLRRLGTDHIDLPTAQQYGMGVLTYGPLSSGWLSGRVDPTAGDRAALGRQLFDLSIPANHYTPPALADASAPPFTGVWSRIHRERLKTTPGAPQAGRRV